MNSSSNTRESTTTAVAAIFATVAFGVAFILAAQLAVGVVGLSYARWISEGTSSGVVEGVAVLAGAVNSLTIALWSEGLARAALLIAAFIAGTIALRRAFAQAWLRNVALALSIMFIVLATLVLLLCSFRFALTAQFPFDELLACAVLSGLFVILALVPVYMYRQYWLCRIYAIPFAVLIAIYLILILLAPGPLGLGFRFVGNLALLLVQAAITGGLVYAARLMRHLQ